MKIFHLFDFKNGLKIGLILLLFFGFGFKSKRQESHDIIIYGGTSAAREYHVTKNGNNNNPGTAEKPFLTIQAAANVARPGDVITVHQGTYRERIDPPRGGLSASERIVFRLPPVKGL